MSDPRDILHRAEEAMQDAKETLAAGRAYINELQKRRRARLIAEGRCPDCLEPVEGSYRTCLECRRKRRNRRLRRTA